MSIAIPRNGVSAPTALFLPLLIVAIVVASLSARGAYAQEEMEIPGEEEPDLELIEGAVKAVMGRGLEAFDPSPEDAVTTKNPDVEPEILRLSLLPLPLDDLTNELEAWRLLVEERTAVLSEARVRLYAVDLSDAEVLPGQESAVAAEREAAGVAADSEPVEEAEANRVKQAIVDEVAELHKARVAAADRLQVVLRAYEAKGGEADVLEEYAAYASAISETGIDVSDTETAYKTITSWLTSDTGGIRILRNVGTVLAAVAGAWLLGFLLSFVINRALKQTAVTSTLLRRFLRAWIQRIAILLGILWGLSLIGVSLVPLLAALGAAGFILAFAFQDSLGNFASGLIILFQKPFDAGDSVEAAGIEGTIDAVTLFCTYMSTAENKQVIVPNNMIWEDVIVNATGTATRRLSVEFVVDADQDVNEVERILLKIMNEHPEVLQKPEPEVQLSEIGGDGMHFVCWPWVPTEKRDDVRWDLVTSAGKQLSLIRGATKAAR